VHCGFLSVSSHIVGGVQGTTLTAGIGDTVLRVSREKNMKKLAFTKSISFTALLLSIDITL